MQTISTIYEEIAHLMQEKRKGAITPEYLGNLLTGMVDALQPTILTVNVGVSKTQFVNDEQFQHVWNCMQEGIQVSFCIAICYASGSKNFYFPTCVKSSYISLHAKAGSCELHLNSDGSFTISGTSLW